MQWAERKDFSVQLIVVDDGSVDCSGDQVRSAFAHSSNVECELVRHSVNKGYSSAVRGGLDRATGDIIGFMDSDGQFDPGDFELLLPHVTSAPVVVGVREHRADPWPRKLNAALYRAALRCVFGVCAADIDCGMKLIRREKWHIIRPSLVSGALFNGEMFVRMLHADVSYIEVPIRHLPRTTGKATGAKLSVILRAAWEMLRLMAAFPTIVFRIGR